MDFCIHETHARNKLRFASEVTLLPMDHARVDVDERILQPTRQLHIGFRRIRMAGGMVVDEDDRRRVCRATA